MSTEQGLPNLHEVDGDPRKMSAVRRLVKRFPQAIAYWHNSGIDERVPGLPGSTKHRHGVLGHQFGGAMAAEAIGDMLKRAGVLNEQQVHDVVLANLIHDADKTTDMKFIIMAMGGKDEKSEVSWSKVEEIVKGTDLPNKSEVLADLKEKCERYFDNSVPVGERVHVARAMVAGRVHKERLAKAGFSSRIIDIQSATEYTGCDEVDRLLDRRDQLPPDEQVRVIQKCIVNYVDNGMMESELVKVEVRTKKVFQKPINVALSEAYAGWNEKGETAENKQIRVGRRIEEFLAGLIGVEPGMFLDTIEKRMQGDIASV